MGPRSGFAGLPYRRSKAGAKRRIMNVISSRRGEYYRLRGWGVTTSSLAPLPRSVGPTCEPSWWKLLNVRSARKRKELIREHTIDQNTDIMCLTETCLREEETPTIKEFLPPGYGFMGVARPEEKRKGNKKSKSKGGGVGILFKDGLRIRRVGRDVRFSSFEHLEAMVTTPSRDIRLVVLYRSPKSAPTGFLEDFSSFLDSLVLVRGLVIIVGNFNIHVDDTDLPFTNRFSRLLDEYGMTQHVRTPTHRKGHIPDLFITNDCAGVISDVSVYDYMIADHSSVMASLLVGQPPRKFQNLYPPEI